MKDQNIFELSMAVNNSEDWKYLEMQSLEF